MAVTEAHTRASVKYNKARDNIMIRPDKPEGAQIRADAAAPLEPGGQSRTKVESV